MILDLGEGQGGSGDIILLASSVPWRIRMFVAPLSAKTIDTDHTDGVRRAVYLGRDNRKKASVER